MQCPECPGPRFIESRLVAQRIRDEVFTGRCLGHQMPSEDRNSERPQNDLIQWSCVRVNGRLMSLVTCPACGATRPTQTGPLGVKVRSQKFTGLCLPCSPNAHKRKWEMLGPGRRVDPVKGYVRLSPDGVADCDRQLYDEMRQGRSYVLEHRFIMALQVGRALSSNELVDHKDGIKTNNTPSNLRIYLKGKNEEGSSSGWGTFYDEWQRAEGELNRLRREQRE